MNYIKREVSPKLKKALLTEKVVIIIGARQVGKTTLVEHTLKNKNALFLNLDVNAYKNQFLAFSKLEPEKALKFLRSPDYLVIDEAQRLTDTGKIIKGFYDSKVSCKFILLGSSSLNLLGNTAESLTGRNIKIYVTPLTVGEILKNQKWFIKEQREPLTEQLDVFLFEILTFGGYPEIQKTLDRKEYLLNLVSDYLFKDILQLGIIKNEDVLHNLLSLIARQTGQLVSIHEIANSLNVSRQTVEKYLDLLKKTFVIFELKPYSTNLRNELKKSSKYYFWDTGIRNAIINELDINPLRSDIGGLFENFIIAEFAKQNILQNNLNNMYFWRTKEGNEIDLVIRNGLRLKGYELGFSKNKITGKGAFLLKYKTASVNLINKNNYLDYILN